jgi:chromosome partitioning protein
MNPKMLIADAANLLGFTVQGIHKKLKSAGLPFEKSQNKIFFKHEAARKLFNFRFAPKIIAIEIVKGGTGKSTLTHSIAVRANLYGARVLCIDLDQQGNLSQAFQINPEKIPVLIDVINENIDIDEAIIPVTDGLDVLPSRIENAAIDNTLMLKRIPMDRVYRDRLEPLRERYDLILIDCPPALGQSVAAATLAADFVISPVTPEKFSLSGLKVTAQEIAEMEKTYKKIIPIRIVLNKFDTRTTLSHETLSSLIKHPTYSLAMFKSYIRISQEFPNVIAQGISIYDPTRNSSAKEDIDLLIREILGISEIKPDKNMFSLGSLEKIKLS